MIQGSLPNSWWSSAPYTGSISQHSVTSEERPWACHMHTTLVRHQWKNYTHRRAWCHMEHPVVLYANWLSVVSITHINSIPLWRKCGPHNDDSHSDKHLTNIYFTRVVARMDDNIQFESKKKFKKILLKFNLLFLCCVVSSRRQSMSGLQEARSALPVDLLHWGLTQWSYRPWNKIKI